MCLLSIWRPVTIARRSGRGLLSNLSGSMVVASAFRLAETLRESIYINQTNESGISVSDSKSTHMHIQNIYSYIVLLDVSGVYHIAHIVPRAILHQQRFKRGTTVYSLAHAFVCLPLAH